MTHTSLLGRYVLGFAWGWTDLMNEAHNWSKKVGAPVQVRRDATTGTWTIVSGRRP